MTLNYIVRALQKKIEEGSVVRVFYDTGGSKGIERQLPKEVAFPIKSTGLMHKKIVAVDEMSVFMGSANLTESSLHMHDNLVLGCYHKGLSTFLQTSLDPSYQFTIEGQDLELWSLPEQEKKALGRILNEINNAKHSIRVCMFTFTSKEIAAALLQAKKRGVKVEVAFDFYSARGASKQNLETLQKENIATFTSNGGKLLHHKWCMIDEKNLILGSTNWTGSAFSKNDDCLIFLQGLLPNQIQMMETIWNTLDLE
ncbi:MAG: phospholipase D-like domain-containing protein [Chlamydiae bacterium]|nr:phospholipase D-like domain-containing protein [Chlamydiota bacterium]